MNAPDRGVGGNGARSPRRVAFVSDSVPERNGVGAYYADLVAQLDDRGFESTFLCPDQARKGLRFPLPGDTTQRIWIPSPRSFGRTIRELAPHAIVVATPGPYGLLGVRWARKLGVRLIVGFHTHYAGVTDLYSRSILRVFSRGYFRVADRVLFRNADHVLGNSEAMVRLARQLGADDVRRIGTLVPRPVLEAPTRPIGDRLERVLFAGRLAPEKRISEVVSAAERLPGLRFTIAGDGPLLDEVGAAARRLPNLEATGWLSRAELLEHMDAADALVLPSEMESFGTVALEAMARERIAVVTDTCGIADWPSLAEHLVVFSPERPLHEVLSGLAEDSPDSLRSLARRAREAAVDLNRRTLEQWIGLLSPGQDDHSDESGRS